MIRAEEVETGTRAFGFSVSGGKDVDANQYPDVFIGAYDSNKAVLFRTKPVVSVTGYPPLLTKQRPQYPSASQYSSTSQYSSIPQY